jgi:hypothetical protein
VHGTPVTGIRKAGVVLYKRCQREFAARLPPGDPDMTAKSELILEIGTEGGEITIFGVKAFHGWFFRSSVLDQNAMYLSEEDRGDLPVESRHGSDWVDSLEAALELIDKYRWHNYVDRPGNHSGRHRQR